MRRSTPASSPSGLDSSVSSTDEVRQAGDTPLWEVPGWRTRFGVVAGITGIGDQKGQPFDLGLWSASPVRETMERWRAFRSAFPEHHGHVMSHQVHGDRVLWHQASAGWTIHEGADGHATSAEGLLLMVTVADCVPIYLIAPSQRTIALLHSGWRGTAAGILARGVEMLHRKTGVDPADLVMHLGVAISGPAYEVGAEVVRGVGLTPAGPGPWHVDLRDVLAEQARGLGVGEVSRSGHCTVARRADFFSHRGSGGADGRMIAYLGMNG